LIVARHFRDPSDPGRHDQEFIPAGFSDRGRVLGGRDDPGQSRILGKTGKMQRRLPCSSGEPEQLQIIVVQTGQNGYRENRRRLFLGSLRKPSHRIDRVRHHPHPAEGMQVEHGHAESAGGLRRTGDGVGNIVEFKIEKDFSPSDTDLSNNLRPEANKRFLSDLEQADMIPQTIHPGKGILHLRTDIEGKDQPFLRGANRCILHRR